MAQNITSLLDSSDPQDLRGGLAISSAIAMAGQRRRPDNFILTYAFEVLPKLATLGSKFINDSSPEAAENLRIVMQTHRSSIRATFAMRRQVHSLITLWQHRTSSRVPHMKSAC